MLDPSLTMFSINATTQVTEKVQNYALQIRNCKVIVFGRGRIYSEFEDMTIDWLNRDQGFGAMDIEIAFQNNVTTNAYPQFYSKCFVLRTDTGYHLKPMKLSNYPCDSKVNQNGELVIGVRYFFQREKEINEIQNCNCISIECFVALEKPKNVYGVMCQLNKENEEWKLEIAHTYKPKYARNIKHLID